MARTLGAALRGVEGFPIEVEVRISSQLPRIDVVGLPEAAVRESAARVRAAIQSAGVPFPSRRVTVNLAPAELRKSGAGLDLPIAVGILKAAGTLGDASLERLGFLGELALDGRLRPVRGALALCLAMRDAGCRSLIAPRASAPEAALTPDVEVLIADDLQAVVAFVRDAEPLDQSLEPALGRRQRTHDGVKIAPCRIRCAVIGHDDAPHIFDIFA
ncbi:MAG: magnesium chelatase domain-containing protein, partial [Myxococcota bacterium]|nr:magnesium chelatase domain-containing protein [Myxococcota bacterium]